MRVHRRILLVAVLTILLIAAGMGGVRLYLSPLADQAAREALRPEDNDDVLPSACRDELAAMDGQASGEPADTRKSDRGNDRLVQSGGAGNVLRGGQREDALTTVSQAPARLARGSDADARPIGTFNPEPKAVARSAEWNAPSTASAKPRPARTVILPVSVQEAAPSRTLDSLKTVDVLELMRRLRSDGETQRADSRRELLRRGFSEVDLELARQLFSPDIAARKQLAMAVPRLASVDAARWLMWLAADPQPEVRRAAITTLATTGDPGLLERVEDMARKDSDEQVQALADQIAKQRELALHPGGANPLR